MYKTCCIPGNFAMLRLPSVFFITIIWPFVMKTIEWFIDERTRTRSIHRKLIMILHPIPIKQITLNQLLKHFSRRVNHTVQIHITRIWNHLVILIRKPICRGWRLRTTCITQRGIRNNRICGNGLGVGIKIGVGRRVWWEDMGEEGREVRAILDNVSDKSWRFTTVWEMAEDKEDCGEDEENGECACKRCGSTCWENVGEIIVVVWSCYREDWSCSWCWRIWHGVWAQLVFQDID